MKTIVTHVHLKPDARRDLDTAMRRRLSAARKRQVGSEDNSSGQPTMKTSE